jgi:hypothetical protein
LRGLSSGIKSDRILDRKFDKGVGQILRLKTPLYIKKK